MACILRERKCGVQQRDIARVLCERSVVFNNVLVPVFYVR